jgi:hypothetical protein
MITFHGMKTYPSRMMLVFVCFLVLQGCTECDDDICGYKPETIGLWSDDNSKLAGIFIDYGDDKSPSDNIHSIFTLNPDGSDFSPLYELEGEQVLEYYSSIQNYMILTEPHSSGLGSRRYTKLDLQSLNTEILVTNDQPCLDRQILPSLDGSVLAVVEVTGQEDGYVGDNDSSGSESLYYIHHGNSDDNGGCKSLSMKVYFIDENTGDNIVTFLNENIDLKYYVFKDNIMSIAINMYWSEQGFIFNNSTFIDDYYLLKSDGSYTAYDFPKNCYPLASNSSLLSHNNVQAEVYGFVDKDVYSESAEVELIDMKVTNEPTYISPSAGKEICVL